MSTYTLKRAPWRSGFSPVRRYKKHGAVQSTLLLGAMLTLLTAAGFYFYNVTVLSPHYLKDTLCQENTPPPESTVLLIDRTDALSKRHLQAIRNTIDALTDIHAPAIAVRGRVEIKLIDADGAGLMRSLVVACRPPISTSESATGATSKRLLPVYKKFVELLESVVTELGQASPSSDASPLFLSIQEVSRQKGWADALGAKRLVIASDLLENVPGGVREKENPRLVAESFLQTDLGRETRADLKGAQISVLYLERQRASALQTPAHIRFWKTWFTSMGAESVTFERIPE